MIIMQYPTRDRGTVELPKAQGVGGALPEIQGIGGALPETWEIGGARPDCLPRWGGESEGMPIPPLHFNVAIIKYGSMPKSRYEC